MHLRFPALLLAVGAVAVASCQDSTGLGPRLPNSESHLAVFAINGTSPAAPTGLRVRPQVSIPIDASFSFEVAFDLNATGDSVVVYTVREIANQLVGVTRVGLQATSATFEQITEAPTGGFVYDSTLRVAVGGSILVDVIDPSCQLESFSGFNIRAKMVVDSIDAVNRKLFLHMLTNRNCGLRNLEPGEPRN